LLAKVACSSTGALTGDGLPQNKRSEEKVLNRRRFEEEGGKFQKVSTRKGDFLLRLGKRGRGGGGRVVT